MEANLLTCKRLLPILSIICCGCYYIMVCARLTLSFWLFLPVVALIAVAAFVLLPWLDKAVWKFANQAFFNVHGYGLGALAAWSEAARLFCLLATSMVMLVLTAIIGSQRVESLIDVITFTITLSYVGNLLILFGYGVRVRLSHRLGKLRYCKPEVWQVWQIVVGEDGKL